MDKYALTLFCSLSSVILYALFLFLSASALITTLPDTFLWPYSLSITLGKYWEGMGVSWTSLGPYSRDNVHVHPTVLQTWYAVGHAEFQLNKHLNILANLQSQSKNLPACKVVMLGCCTVVKWLYFSAQTVFCDAFFYLSILFCPIDSNHSFLPNFVLLPFFCPFTSSISHSCSTCLIVIYIPTWPAIAWMKPKLQALKPNCRWGAVTGVTPCNFLIIPTSFSHKAPYTDGNWTTFLYFPILGQQMGSSLGNNLQTKTMIQGESL